CRQHAGCRPTGDCRSAEPELGPTQCTFLRVVWPVLGSVLAAALLRIRRSAESASVNRLTHALEKVRYDQMQSRNRRRILHLTAGGEPCPLVIRFQFAQR